MADSPASVPGLALTLDAAELLPHLCSACIVTAVDLMLAQLPDDVSRQLLRPHLIRELTARTVADGH